MVARIGGGQPVREDFAAHMAMFAASIRVVGAEADNVRAARRDKRHATDDDKRNQVIQSAFLPHVRKLYNIVSPTVKQPRRRLCAASASKGFYRTKIIKPPTMRTVRVSAPGTGSPSIVTASFAR